jgi:hypothetical protein
MLAVASKLETIACLLAMVTAVLAMNAAWFYRAFARRVGALLGVCHDPPPMVSTLRLCGARDNGDKVELRVCPVLRWMLSGVGPAGLRRVLLLTF